jgi:hypothetical protein
MTEKQITRLRLESIDAEACEQRPQAQQPCRQRGGSLLTSVEETQLRDIASQLASYCRNQNWSGYDPYDALNSPLFDRFTWLQGRVFRIAATQLLRRSPINLRKLLCVPATQNAKAIALFLSAFLRLRTVGLATDADYVRYLIERLIALRSTGMNYWCWGYSFPWQGRKIFVPTGAPNLVCTSFAANGLLDAYEQKADERCLEMAEGAAEYVLNELYWSDGDSAAGFSYPLPGLRGETYNANLLASALLCRIYRHTGKTKFVEAGLRAARHAVAQQRIDGSWYYGQEPSQHWIDNFHTGFNLCALKSIAQSLGTDEFDSGLRRGLNFYVRHFFRVDGAPRYFHDRTYPIDIHSVAQSIITLLSLRHIDPGNAPLARSVWRWAVDHMWDERGFFYYRVLRSGKIRIPYMRWSEAWMLLATAILLATFNERSESATHSRGDPA